MVVGTVGSGVVVVNDLGEVVLGAVGEGVFSFGPLGEVFKERATHERTPADGAGVVAGVVFFVAAIAEGAAIVAES